MFRFIITDVTNQYFVRHSNWILHQQCPPKGKRDVNTIQRACGCVWIILKLSLEQMGSRKNSLGTRTDSSLQVPNLKPSSSTASTLQMTSCTSTRHWQVCADDTWGSRCDQRCSFSANRTKLWLDRLKLKDLRTVRILFTYLKDVNEIQRFVFAVIFIIFQ